MDKRLVKHLRKFKIRIFLRRFSRYFMVNIGLSLIAILLLVITSKFYPIFFKGKIIVALLFLATISSLIISFLKRPKSIEAAREADYNGLDEIVSSAYEFSLKKERSDIEDELYERAIKELENMKSTNRVKILINKKLLTYLLVLIIVVIGVDFIETEVSTNVNSELKEIKKIEDMENEIEKKVEKIDNIDSKNLLKELKKALKDIHNPEKIDEEIFKAKKDLNEEVKKNLESKLGENEYPSISESQKDEILSSENSLETLAQMIKDSEINRNIDEMDDLKDLSESVSDENASESKEAIESLDELNDKIMQHNSASKSQGST